MKIIALDCPLTALADGAIDRVTCGLYSCAYACLGCLSRVDLVGKLYLRFGDVVDNGATRPIGERGHVRVDNQAPGGECQPHYQQCEDGRPDTSKSLYKSMSKYPYKRIRIDLQITAKQKTYHILGANVRHTGNDRIRRGANGHVKSHAARQRRREHQEQRVHFGRNGHLGQHGQ